MRGARAAASTRAIGCNPIATSGSDADHPCRLPPPGVRVKIGIIGAGNMDRAFATQLAAAGPDVTITATDTAHA